jgi:hypothetical protein
VLDDSPVPLVPDAPAPAPAPSRPPSPPVRGGVKFELPRHLADDIASVLGDASPEPRKTQPPPPPEPQSEAEETQAQRLMVQIRGLVMQLADAQQTLSQRDLEVERMREELENARDVRDSEILRLRKDLENAKAALERALRHG